MIATLYSFKRCPYAIRARLALAAAGLRPGHDLELREVALKAKPPELLAASAKGTVPVLVLNTPAEAPGLEGQVIEESLAIMQWALAQADPEGWISGWTPAEHASMAALIGENDGVFKHHLDRFKYPDRYPSERSEPHRLAGLAILHRWSARLEAGGWLLGDRACIADGALLPFVRQFRLADPEGFDAAHGLKPLQLWLQRFLTSEALAAALAEPWTASSPWRSPSQLYHLALSDEWHQARSAGRYERSTRGQSLGAVGFIHLSEAHQLEATAARFYNDLPRGSVTLLVIEPRVLVAQGLNLRHEPAPGNGELFPHLYGPLPLEAVVRSEPWRP